MESVLAQVDVGMEGRLEILISDNASTDATREVVHEYMARYPQTISYRCNPSNMGYSRNVDAVIRHSRGDFILLLSDDDGLEDNALRTLWNILEQQQDLGVVFLSETSYDPELTAPLGGSQRAPRRNGGLLYKPGLEYLRQCRIFPPALVSGYVVRREAWIEADPSEYFDTLIVHSLTVLRILVKQLQYSAYVCYTPCIKYRTEGMGSTCSNDELFPFVFHLDHLIGCNSVRSECSPEIYRYLHQQAMRSIAYHIMDLKGSGGRINVALLRKRLVSLADPKDPLLWLNRVLLRMPGWMLRFPFRIAVVIRESMRRKAG